jgi:hypothetical protein
VGEADRIVRVSKIVAERLITDSAVYCSMDIGSLTLRQLVRILSAQGGTDAYVGCAAIDGELVKSADIAAFISQERERLDVSTRGEYMQNGGFTMSYDEQYEQ